MTYQEFVKKYNVKFTQERVSQRPDDHDFREANHYHCRIRSGRHSMSLYFSQGYGIKHEPQAKDVLDCLASDANSFDNAGSFEEWASEYGYDVDSRKAEKIYRAVERQTIQLKRVLGSEAYDQLLYHTERL